MEIKIFQLTDSDWVAATNLQSAKKCLQEMVGFTDDEIEEECKDAYALSEADMNSLVFLDDIYNPEQSARRSFKEELLNRIENGEKFPQYFGTNEY